MPYHPLRHPDKLNRHMYPGFAPRRQESLWQPFQYTRKLPFMFLAYDVIRVLILIILRLGLPGLS